MTEVFADAFYWLALVNPDDDYHERVVAYRVPTRLVTSCAVQIEVMDGLCEARLRPLAIRFWHETSSNPRLMVVPLERELLDRAVRLFEQRDDKDWSLTDCMSFVIMQERGIVHALTRDHHFTQAGFRVLFE